jgi:hypothetical protein
VAEAMVDDELAVVSGRDDIFAFRFSSPGHSPVPAVVEVPRATVELLAGRAVTVEYRDVYADVVQASPLWLIWTP